MILLAARVLEQRGINIGTRSVATFRVLPGPFVVLPGFATPSSVAVVAASYLPENPKILEGGAYLGKNSVKLAKIWPKAQIYSFEPVPELAEKTKTNTRTFPNIHVYELALSDKNGTATMYLSELVAKPDQTYQSSSLFAPSEFLRKAPRIQYKKQINVPTTTIDAWAKKNSVDHIDLLYLDIQGAELAAMKGAPEIMKTVQVVLAEIEFVEVYTGQPLYGEVRSWLEEQGFRMIAGSFDPSDPTSPVLGASSWFADAIFVRARPATVMRR